MPTNQELTRPTIPDSSTSFRSAADPDGELRAKSPDEQHLRTRVQQALVDAGIGTEDLTIEIVEDRVNVRGFVADHEELVRVGDVIRELPEVGEVYEQLAVR